mmetsp:Transcript_112003/g.302220  ORF Transcript_112003/g.302220 Transcript_112003/m.302220 type:complete len:314 (-) Transcript_112003:216-1157(-)
MHTYVWRCALHVVSDEVHRGLLCRRGLLRFRRLRGPGARHRPRLCLRQRQRGDAGEALERPSDEDAGTGPLLVEHRGGAVGPHRVLPGLPCASTRPRLAILGRVLPAPLANPPHQRRRRCLVVVRGLVQQQHLRSYFPSKSHDDILDSPADLLVHVQPAHLRLRQARGLQEASLGLLQSRRQCRLGLSGVQPPRLHDRAQDLALGKWARLVREGRGRGGEGGRDTSEPHEGRHDLGVRRGHLQLQAHEAALLLQSRLHHLVDAQAVLPHVPILGIEDVQQPCCGCSPHRPCGPRHAFAADAAAICRPEMLPEA